MAAAPIKRDTVFELDMSDDAKWGGEVVRQHVIEEAEEGLYSLIFVRCKPTSSQARLAAFLRGRVLGDMERRQSLSKAPARFGNGRRERAETRRSPRRERERERWRVRDVCAFAAFLGEMAQTPVSFHLKAAFYNPGPSYLSACEAALPLLHTSQRLENIRISY